jgi:nicotinamide-nucleotide amidase
VTAELVARLRQLGQTVATAESLTAGMVAAELTSVPGSSAVLRGGLIVYATELKAKLAGVDPALLAEHGAVHHDVAVQLAEGARERCEATWGLGLTGVAGPDPQDGVAPGTVYVAVAGPPGVQVRRLSLAGDRGQVRSGSVTAVLDLLRVCLG